MYDENIMKKWWEVFHKKGKTNQQDVFSWCIQGRLKHLDVNHKVRQ